jgi:hypothetical protein
MSGTKIHRIAVVIAVLVIAPTMVRAAFFHQIRHQDISVAQPILADVNGDGRADLIGSGPTVWFGNVDGTFQPGVSYGSGGQQPLSIAVADVNGDGRSDIIQLSACDSGGNCSNGVVGVLLGNGDGTFQTALVFSAGPNPKQVAIADANGDGKADIVLIAGSNAGALLGNGNGTF